MKRISSCLLMGLLLGGTTVRAQSDGDVIINEIGNHGTKKGTYVGGDFVELLVLKPGGVTLAGWYLTDLSSLTGNPKETEGRVRFSDADGSVFRQVIPQGTYILVWLSSKDSVAEVAQQTEDAALNDGNNRVVVFAHNSPRHIDQQQGYINLTGKDNFVLLKSWNKDAAIDAVVWGGSSKWTGCQSTDLGEQVLVNGTIERFLPGGKSPADFKNNNNPQNWKSSTDAGDATPGRLNGGVDDSTLQSTQK